MGKGNRSRTQREIERVAAGGPVDGREAAARAVAEQKGPNRLQRFGGRVQSAAQAVTRHGDTALGRVGVKTKTGAMLIGGGGVALSQRPRRKEEVGKAGLAELLANPDTLDRAGRALQALAGQRKPKTARTARRVATGVGALALGGGTLGASLEGGKQVVRRNVEKSFASRDENSSIGTTYERRGPEGPYQRRSGAVVVGRKALERGNPVGQRSRVDANSSPRVTSVQPRRPTGQFVSHDNDLKVFHPKYKSSRRAPRTSALQCWGKGKDDQSRTFLGKALEPSVAVAINSRGRRIA